MLPIGGNILTGLAVNTAMSTVSSVVQGVLGSFSEGTNLENYQSFADALSGKLDSGNLENAPDISVLGGLAQPLAQPVVQNLQNALNQVTDSTNSIGSIGNTNPTEQSGIVNSLSTAIQNINDNAKIVDPSQLSEIEKILSNVPVTNPTEGLKTTSADQTPNPLDAADIAIQGLSQASSKNPLTPVGDAAKALDTVLSDTQLHPLFASNNQNKNSQNESDPRILGENNLKTIANNVSKDVVKDLNKVLENGIFAENEFKQKIENANNKNSDSIFSAQNLTGHKNDLLNGLQKVESVTKTLPANENPTYRVVSVSKNENTIELKLEPETLGKLSIRLGFNHDGKANLVVIADRQDTIDLLKKDSAGLEKILSENGIKADAGSMSFNLKEQNQQQQQQQWAFYEKPVAFNINDYTAQDDSSGISRISSSPYNNHYGENLLNILV